MKPYIYLFFLFMLLPAPVFAGEWDFSYSGHVHGTVWLQRSLQTLQTQ